MVADRLQTDASGRIPKFLRMEDERLRKAKKEINREMYTREKPGIKRGIAILYSQNKVAYVDYEMKNPITGRYKMNYMMLGPKA